MWTGARTVPHGRLLLSVWCQLGASRILAPSAPGHGHGSRWLGGDSACDLRQVQITN